jgi:hypothetical protein
MKKLRWSLPVVASLLAIGCGKTETPVVDAPNPGQQAPALASENPNQATTPADDRDSFRGASPATNAVAKNLPVQPSSPPDEVVKAFLNALKAGDDGITAGLLTTVAREETAKSNLAVQPPGTPNAQYQVTAAQVDPQDPTLAQVACVWTETDDQGGQRNDEVIWVLKKESQGWRVCGMASHLPTRKEPVLFNFEDPAEMMRVSDEIAQEMEKFAQQPEKTAPAGNQPAALEANAPKSGNTLRK